MATTQEYHSMETKKKRDALEACEKSIFGVVNWTFSFSVGLVFSFSIQMVFVDNFVAVCRNDGPTKCPFFSC